MRVPIMPRRAVPYRTLGGLQASNIVAYIARGEMALSILMVWYGMDAHASPRKGAVMPPAPLLQCSG